MDPPKADPQVLRELKHLRTTYEAVHTNELRNTDLGHWINEAFVVRLSAVMEAHDIFGRSKSIDDSLTGAKDVDLCRRLRNKVVHSRAMVGSQDSRKLDRELRTHYGLGDQVNIIEDKFILSKDTVLRPMLDSCYTYCELLLESEGLRSNRS